MATVLADTWERATRRLTRVRHLINRTLRTAENRAAEEMPEKDLSAVDRRALTEMLVDKIIIERHPSKIDKDGRRHYLIRAIPYQDPQQEAERLKAVHEAQVKIVPRILTRGSVTEGSFSPARASGLVHNVTGSNGMRRRGATAWGRLQPSGEFGRSLAGVQPGALAPELT